MVHRRNRKRVRIIDRDIAATSDKIADFAGMVQKNCSRLDIVMMKLHYVDVDKSTDVDSLFSAYRRMVDQVHAACPSIRMMHLTVPLQTHYFGGKQWVLSFVRPDWGNMQRSRYNRLLRGAYKGVEPFLDLAEIESSTREGGRCLVTQRGESFEVMSPVLTSDGGHLNNEGRTLVASKLIVTCAASPTLSLRFRAVS